MYLRARTQVRLRVRTREDNLYLIKSTSKEIPTKFTSEITTSALHKKINNNINKKKLILIRKNIPINKKYKNHL